MSIASDGTGYTAIAREAERGIMDKIGRKPLKDLPDISTIRP